MGEEDTQRRAAGGGSGSPGNGRRETAGNVIPFNGSFAKAPPAHGTAGTTPQVNRTAHTPSSSVITGNGYAVGRRDNPEQVTFTRRELDALLRLYGFKVASGEWRDYAIDMLKDRAVFSVFRRASEMPLHCIEKVPSLARKQGQWCVTGADGRVLKRGHELETVLRVLEKRPKLKVI